MELYEPDRTSRTDALSLRIVSAVADREGVPEEELQPPLFDVVDPDALNSLLTTDPPAQGVITVSFDFAGYRVVVDSDGTVRVR